MGASRPTSRYTAARTTTRGNTVQLMKGVDLQQRVYQLPKGWLLVHLIGISKQGSVFEMMDYIPPDVPVQTEAVPSPRRITLMFTSTTAASKKTPKKERGGGGSEKSGRQ